MPGQVHWPVRRVDEGDHVLDLALYSVIAAFAAASPFHSVDGVYNTLLELSGYLLRLLHALVFRCH